MQNLKIIAIVAAGIIASVVVAGSIVFWPTKHNNTNQTTQNIKTTSAQSTGLGADIYEQSQPPANKVVPETNPFKTSTNPFAETYQNPFEQ